MEKSNAVSEEELPGEMQKGKREELVELSDIQLIDGMTKDELNDYAITRLGVDLVLGDKIKPLKLKVITMIKERLEKGKNKTDKSPDDKSTNNQVADKQDKDKGPEFIFNPKNRRVLEYTENLATREDLIPCWIVDEKGKRL